jgi:TonB family protein
LAKGAQRVVESANQQMEAPAGMETEAAGETLALSERLVAPVDKSRRAFRLALVAALLLHASLLIEIGRSVPRAIGDRSGASDAIAVDLVTEADLRSREIVSLPAAGVPAPPPQPAAETPPPEPKPEEPQPQAEAPAPPPPAPEAPAPEKPQQQAALPDFDTMLKDLATTPLPEEAAKETPQEKAQEAKETKETKETNETKETAKAAEKAAPPSPPRKKAQEQARLEPTPRDFMNAPPGRSAAASRPPGITRSGENDEFGRAVVRALRQTMPPPRGIFGRVTVRLILTQNGDLAEVRVLNASGTSLDQSVVFATKQTYFPLPPYNATVADRTFLITYVYR